MKYRKVSRKRYDEYLQWKKEQEKGEKKNVKTFTKTWVERLMYIAVFDLQLSYLLAFLGREQIAETLSITVVVEIIGVLLGYFAKAFYETKESEQTRLLERKMEEQS